MSHDGEPFFERLEEDEDFEFVENPDEIFDPNRKSNSGSNTSFIQKHKWKIVGAALGAVAGTYELKNRSSCFSENIKDSVDFCLPVDRIRRRNI